jgi:hypothetical protein
MPPAYYAFSTWETQVARAPLRVCGKPGVPSWDALDAGTRLLAETVEVLRARALSLGCGTGIVRTRRAAPRSRAGGRQRAGRGLRGAHARGQRLRPRTRRAARGVPTARST